MIRKFKDTTLQIIYNILKSKGWVSRHTLTHNLTVGIEAIHRGTASSRLSHVAEALMFHGLLDRMGSRGSYMYRYRARERSIKRAKELVVVYRRYMNNIRPKVKKGELGHGGMRKYQAAIAEQKISKLGDGTPLQQEAVRAERRDLKRIGKAAARKRKQPRQEFVRIYVTVLIPFEEWKKYLAHTTSVKIKGKPRGFIIEKISNQAPVLPSL